MRNTLRSLFWSPLSSFFFKGPTRNTDESLRLRTTSDNNSTAPGIAEALETHIAVQFRWLIVPIASVILSLILLSAVIFETARSGAPAWKASSIAALLSLDHDAGNAIASQDHSRSLDERARDLALRLKQGENRQWTLEAKY